MRMKETEDDIIRDLRELGDDMSQYTYLISCGKELELLPEEERTDQWRIRECQVKTWVKPSLTAGKVSLKAYSEALIVSGVLALIQEIYEQRTPEEVREYPCALLDYEEIRSFLTEDQVRGLRAILENLKQLG